MKNFSYTPGPWYTQGQCICDADTANVLAAVMRTHLRRNCDALHAEDLANARLIANAPDLVECLLKFRSAVAALREGKRDGGTFGRISMIDEEAEELLKKIKGEKS